MKIRLRLYKSRHCRGLFHNSPQCSKQISAWQITNSFESPQGHLLLRKFKKIRKRNTDMFNHKNSSWKCRIKEQIDFHTNHLTKMRSEEIRKIQSQQCWRCREFFRNCKYSAICLQIQNLIDKSHCKLNID